MGSVLAQGELTLETDIGSLEKPQLRVEVRLGVTDSVRGES